MKRRIREIIIGGMIAGLTVMVCGCGKKGMPEDTPWNNGFNAIMETENGYYSDSYYRQNLLFHDKSSGKDILLCGKPECQHQGEESCVATFRNMRVVNAVLYDEAIYILSREYADDVASFNLYRASLDGSTISKVGEAFSAKNTTDRACEFKDVLSSAFIIHKGYAYIPFYLAFSHTEKGFVDGGLLRMNIRTGAVERLYTMEFFTSATVTNLRGCGDYVYYDLVSNRKKDKPGTCRYNIKDGTAENAFGEFGKKNELHAVAVTEEKLYVQTRSPEGKWGLGAFDSRTGKYLGTLFYPDLDQKCPGGKQGILWTQVAEGQDEVGCGRWGQPEVLYTRAIAYQDKILFLGREKAFLYSDKGEKLGETGYDFPVPGLDSQKGVSGGAGHVEYFDYHYPNGTMRMKICQDKLYALCRSDRLKEDNTGTCVFDVYSRALEDIEAGKGNWTFEYATWAPFRAVTVIEGGVTDCTWGDEDRAYSDWSIYTRGDGNWWEE